MRCPLECDAGAELIVGYGARTLDPGIAAEFERHIASCDACCKVAAAQKAVWEALDDAEWRDLPVSPDFDRRLFQRIHAREQRHWWLWRALIPLAACLALAAVILMPQPDRPRAPHARPPQPALQIEQVEHALDDMDLLNQLGAAI
jgi:hypothetical protein